ncbi:MAG: CHRD domain-containing protein, partial [Burkholderiales bacterium]
MRPFSKIIPLAALTLLLAHPAWAESLHFMAPLSTAAEVPVKSGPGNGIVDATLDTATSRLSYTITYAGLSGPATAAHFHGPASATETAGVAIKINGPLASPIRGEATLTHEQAEALMKGQWYV